MTKSRSDGDNHYLKEEADLLANMGEIILLMDKKSRLYDEAYVALFRLLFAVISVMGMGFALILLGQFTPLGWFMVSAAIVIAVLASIKGVVL